MTSYAELKKRLGREFYPDNFRSVAILCDELSCQRRNSVGLFIVAQILWWLDSYWLDRPVCTSEVDKMRQVLVPPIMQYFEAADHVLTPDEELGYLSEITAAFIGWRIEVD